MATVSEVERLIAEERGELERELAKLLRDRDMTNIAIADVRKRLAEAPRLHVRRQKKVSPGEKLADMLTGPPVLTLNGVDESDGF